MAFSVILLIVIITGIVIIALLWLLYFWKKFATTEYQPTTLVRRLSRSLSRGGTHSNERNTDVQLEGQGNTQSQNFLAPTSISAISDRPPSYIETQSQGPIEPPPSYDEAVAK